MFGRKTNSYDQFKDPIKIASAPRKKSKFRKLLNKIGTIISVPFRPFLKSRLGKGFIDTITNREIMTKIGVTLLIILIYRCLSNIPLPGVDMKVYNEFFGKTTTSEAHYLFVAFTGGRLDSPSIVGLGLAAYINASIVMQLLPYAIPRLKELQKEGERGKQIINQATRYITLPLALLYSAAYLILLSQRDLADTGSNPGHTPVYLIQHALGASTPNLQKIIFMALILAAGTLLLMWLSEIITEKGIGNGSSIIITIGILAALPALVSKDISQLNLSDIFKQLLQGNTLVLTAPTTLALIGVIVGLLLTIVMIIFVNESTRNIPIQYARRIRGTETGKGSSLPIKFTLTGVLPIIFTYAILSVPQLLVPLLKNIVDKAAPFQNFLTSVEGSFLYAQNDSVIDQRDLIYAIVYFVLVILFGIFYSYIVMNPNETAENLQKSGAFIPGIRPGKSTESYVAGVLLRISFIGSIVLAFIALLPVIGRDVVLTSTGKQVAILSGIGGTSILIMVSVLLDTMRQFKALRATRSYEKYINAQANVKFNN